MMNKREFFWAAGIEDTFIAAPHRLTGRTLDEYELTGHYESWKDDLKRLSSLGVDMARWGIPWYRVNPEPGVFVWDWVDEVMDAASGEIGLGILLDLLHYGTPAWIKGSFANPGFPSHFEAYAEAALRRYADSLRWVTPVNEPYVNALYCGERGEWPPYGSDERCFLTVLKHLCEGISRVTRLCREMGIGTVQVEADLLYASGDAGAEERSEFLQRKGVLSWEILSGRMREGHPLFAWAVSNGWTDRDTERFSQAAFPDILGINYYPQWSVTKIWENGKTEPLYGGSRYLASSLRRWNRDYERPVMVTETSFRGTPAERAAWLEESAGLVLGMEECAGYTWFPAVDMIDWEYRNSTEPLERFRMPLGLWDHERRENEAAETYREIIERNRSSKE